jgi:hypothetical protein
MWKRAIPAVCGLLSVLSQPAEAQGVAAAPKT